MPIEAARSVPDFSREVYCLLGLPVDRVDLADAEQRIRAAAERRAPCFLSTPNVNWLVASQTDARLRDSVVHSDLSVADGKPLVWLAGLAGIPIRERVAGASLFEALRRGGGRQLSVYFFGGPDGVAEMAARRLNAEGGGLTCSGYTSPGFGSVEDMSSDEVIALINASKADVLAVSLGARKGQEWIERNRGRLDVPVVSHLGAVLHFVAGSVRRAPTWVQRWGLEWLWRIKEEPKLWRRYLSDGIALLRLVVTRGIPYAWRVRLSPPRAEQLAAAHAEAHDEGRQLLLKLYGAWTSANVVRLRRHFLHAALAGKDVTLDMGGVTHVDSAFIGLLMLLHGHLRQRSRGLRFLSVPAAVGRVFTYCCAEFLLDATAEPR